MKEIRIPASVYQDPRLTCTARLVYGEIDRLCRTTGGACQATNQQIAAVYDITPGSVSVCIRNLKTFGYLVSLPSPKNRRILKTTNAGAGISKAEP